MSQTDRIVETLKRELRRKKRTYGDLATILGVTESGVKKAFASRSFSLGKLESICTYLGISLLDLMRLADTEEDGKQIELTLEQEKVLAETEQLFVIYYLILFGLDYSSILGQYDFDQESLSKYLEELDRLRLIRFKPPTSIKVLSVKNPIWIDHGPLYRRYVPKIAREMAQQDRPADLAYYRFVMGFLDSDQIQSFAEKLRRLQSEFLTASKPSGMRSGTSSVALYSIIREWKFSVLEKYQADRNK